MGGAPPALARVAIAGGAALLGVLCVARAAHAQASPRLAAAEELFHAGRELIAEHRYKEACDKLASSQQLDPAVGTLLSLGECYMGQGKAASAWLSYRRAVALASERKDPRSSAAEERATAVEPQLSRLVLRLSDEASASAVQIAVNGETLESGVLREPMPIDPGPTTIVVSQPGYRGWTKRVTIGALGDTVEVLIPKLEPLPDASQVAQEQARVAKRRALGVVLGGTGVVALGVGSILGLEAIAKIHDANRVCPGSTACASQSAVQENATGRTFADVSTVLLPVGAALVGAGAFFYFTAHPVAGADVGAQVGADGARVRVGWSW